MKEKIEIEVRGTPEGFEVLDDGLLYDCYRTEAEANKIAEGLRKEREIELHAEELVDDAVDKLVTEFHLTVKQAKKWIGGAL